MIPTPDTPQRIPIEQLTGSGRRISDPRVLTAMREVPRHEFVPEACRLHAYEDRALPIGYGQTISQPYIVALMTQLIQPRPTDRVLEIGCGCGYQAAVLSRLVEQVYSVEIVEALAIGAVRDLIRLGCRNVHVRVGDGSFGWPEMAPFDAVIVACAPERIPAALVEQLREGGRMVIPVGPDGHQELLLLAKQGGALLQKSVLPVRFVPMTGAAQNR